MIASTAPLPVITAASANPANEVAKKLTGRDYVSWSAISTFRTSTVRLRWPIPATTYLATATYVENRARTI